MIIIKYPHKLEIKIHNDYHFVFEEGLILSGRMIMLTSNLFNIPLKFKDVDELLFQRCYEGRSKKNSTMYIYVNAEARVLNIIEEKYPQ